MDLTNKLLEGFKNFSEEELSEIVDGAKEYIRGESSRWHQSVEAIFEVEGRLFSIDYDEGLTEYQENYYPNQPVEVKAIEKQITITEYVPI